MRTDGHLGEAHRTRCSARGPAGSNRHNSSFGASWRPHVSLVDPLLATALIGRDLVGVMSAMDAPERPGCR